MVTIGTPFSQSAKKVLLLGAGELGKEVAIECQRLGLEVIACDRYANAPAMQVADRSHVFSMLDADALKQVLDQEKPDYVVPEIEAIATDVLAELEAKGLKVVPNARAVQLTMNREGIRRLAAEELGIRTSPFEFCSDYDSFSSAVNRIGYPCVVKPIMSSSGKGQSVLKSEQDLVSAWQYAQEGGRAGAGRVIVEGFVDFDFEITLLTVRHMGGTTFCAPIGHRQENGDYQESWQPQVMSAKALQRSEQIAKSVTDALGGWGLFGVELFIKGDDVIFSEVSPRPHDTGLVTLISQNLSEFALHTRAFLGLPITNITLHSPSASKALLVTGHSNEIVFKGIELALSQPNTDLRLFGKPEVQGTRRMGVILACAETTQQAIEQVTAAADKMTVSLNKSE